MTDKPKTVRLKVSREVAGIVARDAPAELKCRAAEGRLSLAEKDQVVSLFFLAHGADSEIRAKALATVKSLPAAHLLAVAVDPDLHPQLIDFLVRSRLEDVEVMAALLAHPAISSATLHLVAAKGSNVVVSLLAEDEEKLRASSELVRGLLENPRVELELKARWEKSRQVSHQPSSEEVETGEKGGEGDLSRSAAEEVPPEEEQNLSKYQQSLELGVAEKIKTAMTGDKEWRAILMKDANKLVSSAVLKNPRITEGEVLGVALNRSTGEELIRLITLNSDWLKNAQIKKALIQHPRTPLPKALRYMDVLTEKELKFLSKSRNVSRVIVNNARRILIAKEKKK